MIDSYPIWRHQGSVTGVFLLKSFYSEEKTRIIKSQIELIH